MKPANRDRIVIAVAAAAVVAGALLVGPTAVSCETAAVLTGTAGDVRVLRKGSGVDQKAALGLILAPGDLVSVGAGGRAVVVLQSGSIQRLAPGERYSVPQKSTGGSSLLQGIAATLPEMLASGSEGPTVHGMARGATGIDLLTPANTVVLSSSIPFRWSGPAQMQEYMVTVKGGPDSSPVQRRKTSADSLLPPSFELLPGYAYQWWVEGSAGGSTLLTSPVGKFRVIAPEERRRIEQETAELGRLAEGDQSTLQFLTAGLYARLGAREESERIMAALRPGASAAPTRWALLVGVSAYVVPKYELRGPTNDVRLLRDVLMDRFGFAGDHICTLVDREATKEGIVEATKTQLIEKSGPDDAVLFYFSGHGTHLLDDNADEEDGLDEAICPVDVSPEQPDRAIRDDQLEDLFSRIKARDVTVVLDACHSGTGMRGGNGTPRYISLETTRGQEETGKDGMADGARAVTFLAACKADEVAMDAVIQEGRVQLHNGAFTYNLVRSLQKAPEGMTYAALMADVQRDVRQSFEQSPQIEGAVDRPLFTTPTLAPPHVSVVRVDGETVELGAGAASGITRGSLYTIFAPDESEFSGDGVGSARVTSVDSSTAVAIVVRPGESIRPGCKAVEREHGFPDIPVVLGRGYGADADLDSRLMALGFVELAQGSSPSDFVLLKEQSGDRVGLELADGDRKCPRVEGRDVAEALDLLKPQLESVYKLKWLSSLENPQPPFRVNIQGPGGTKYATVKVGEFVTFDLTVERDCHVALISADPNGKVEVIFPNEWNPEGRLLAGRRYSTADLGFKIVAEPPAGRQMVKLIASERRFDVTRPGQVGVTGEQGATTSLPIDPALSGAAEVQPPIALTDWATDYMIVEIK